ncbi:CMRF35-like molecule 5 isoform X1 [Denticeps clupeoides]|uniref:CMRF35-like molecule 5 isoform X1 n=1 Tax=Denticeps clupeoides TaxID=299321 RepID=UPI0010A4014D|nr:CMRF35-like molecule 5 isoform X1 [Denticeps clupeoides]XP_028850294.1 CMRF35-like molecule 5 isoform X1 [Denticeps clupeoides]XP_028850295.1 CMRF35-like molecule 5 isoform X1 [Denticeps clupeoides]
MRATLEFLLFLQGLSCVVMKIHVSGVEGGSVKIQCPYRADYIHRPKYFCRDPCGNKDVLIKSEKSDDFKSVGKYSIYDNSPGRSFTVTIYQLTVRDSGIYYCAPDQWFIDTKTRINVSVSKAVPVSQRPLSVARTSLQDISTSSSTWSTAQTSTDKKGTSQNQTTPAASVTGSGQSAGSVAACGAVLALLIMCILLALFNVHTRCAVLKKSNPDDQAVDVQMDQDNATLYAEVNFPQEETPETICSLIQPETCSISDHELYSLVNPH